LHSRAEGEFHHKDSGKIQSQRSYPRTLLTAQREENEMKKNLIGLAFLACAMVHAGPLEDKTRRLFEVQGIVNNFQLSIDQGRVQAREESKKVMDQMLGELDLSKEYQERTNVAYEKFMKALLTDRTANEIVEVLIKYYAPNFTEEELDKLIEFYGSSVARKDADVSRKAMQQVADSYKAANDQIRVTATSEFVRGLRMIAQECQCARHTQAKKN